MNALVERIVDLAVQIQQIPAPTFEEGERAAFVHQCFLEEGLQDAGIDAAGNVLGRWPGEGRGHRPLVVSAHLDTVFPRQTGLHVRREGKRLYGPGLGDNSIGVAALLGLIWLLKERDIKLPGDLWLVANTGEEGLGDLRGMKAVVQYFGSQVIGYLVLEGMALGSVYHRGIAVHRYRVAVRTPGGHAWSDYGRPSAVHELVNLAAQVTGLSLPASPRTTLNIGRIAGGTSVNTLAAEAWLEMEVRSESPNTLEGVLRAVETLFGAANRPGVQVEAQTVGQRPGGEIPRSHPLVRLAVSCLREQGIEPELIGGSTDANLPLSLGLPALVMGVTTGGGGHTIHEFIEVEPIAQGMDALLAFVQRAFVVEGQR